MALCDSTYYANEVLCEIISKMDQLYESSEDMLATALAAVDAFETASTDALAQVTALEYSADTDGIPFDYTEPDIDTEEPDYLADAPVVPIAIADLQVAPVATKTPVIPISYVVPVHTITAFSSQPGGYDVSDHVVTAGPIIPASYTPTSAPNTDTPPDSIPDYIPDAHPITPAPTISGAPSSTGDSPTMRAGPTIPAAYVVPDASQMLISSAVSDDIFDRASERLSRVALADARKASYSLASKGIGLASASLLMRMREADQELSNKLSEAALEQSVTEGNWYREDAKTLHDLHIKNWPLKPNADVEVFKTEEGLAVDVYKTREGLLLDSYKTEKGLLIDAYKAEEGYTLDAYKALLDATTKSWDLAPRFNLDVYKATNGVELDGWKALQDFNIRSWSLKPNLDVDAYKSYEKLKADAANQNTTSAIKAWNLGFEMELNAYQVEQGLNLDGYKATTGIRAEHHYDVTRLDLQAWEAFDKTSADLYTARANAEIAHHGAKVGAYSAESQSDQRYLAESTNRFNSRLDKLQKHILSEAEKRGWANLELTSVLTKADQESAYALSKANAILSITRATTEEVAKLLVGLAQGMWSSQGYGLRGSASQSISTTSSE